MFISITRLKLKGILKFPLFVIHARKSFNQTNNTKGLIFKSVKPAFYLTFYTLTVWETKEDMLNYRNNSSHLEAMKISKKVSNDNEVFNYYSDKIPTWDNAIKFLKEKKVETNLILN